MSKIKTIDLYYIATISRSIERMVDHITKVKKDDVLFLQGISNVLDLLKDLVDDIDNITYTKALQFVEKAESMKGIEVHDVTTYVKRRINKYLLDISEVLIDWGVTKELDTV
jgi:hypothetical protein